MMFCKKVISSRKLKMFAIRCFLYGKNDYPDKQFKDMIETELSHKISKGGMEW